MPAGLYFDAATEAWVRSSAWPSLALPGATEHKFAGLVAVVKDISGTDPTWVGMVCSGACTYSWGDGSANENVPSATAVFHKFDWDGCYTAAVDVNSTVQNTTYYIESLGDTPQADWNTLAGTSGKTWAVGDGFTAAVNGSTLSNTTGTASVLPYRVATVTVTPQSGQNLTAVDITAQNSPNRTGNAAWLEIAVGSPLLTSLLLSVTAMRPRVLEQVTIVSSALTSTASLFAQCSSLQSVPLFNTSAVTSMASMFTGCVRLRTVPLFDTAAVTTMSGMFNGCSALFSVPQFNTSNVTTMASMFNGCTALSTAPAFNTASVTTMTSMFNTCSSLSNISWLNTATCTNFSSMFSSCSALNSVPLLITSAATTVGSMFLSCPALREVPAFDLANATTLTSFLSGTSSLVRVRATGWKGTFTVANCKLSGAALNELFTNLPDRTSLSSATVTVTGNPGTSDPGYDPTIATAKNWVVTA